MRIFESLQLTNDVVVGPLVMIILPLSLPRWSVEGARSKFAQNDNNKPTNHSNWIAFISQPPECNSQLIEMLGAQTYLTGFCECGIYWCYRGETAEFYSSVENIIIHNSNHRKKNQIKSKKVSILASFWSSSLFFFFFKTDHFHVYPTRT